MGEKLGIRTVLAALSLLEGGGLAVASMSQIRGERRRGFKTLCGEFSREGREKKREKRRKYKKARRQSMLAKR